MQSAFRASLLTVFLIVPLALADPISSKVALNNLGTYSGTFDYNATSATEATLTITLKNLSLAGNGGYLTAFAFNNPGDLITGVTLDSPDVTFGLLGGTTYQNGINSSPYGNFDIGASSGSSWEGGGPPSNGIAVGGEATFTFTFIGTGLDELSLASFFADEAKSEGTGAGDDYEWFVARFRGFNGGGSDKVPGGPGTPPIVVNQNPEPASLVLASIGAGCMFFHARRVRKKTAV